MIEFKGYISGVADKHFYKRCIQTGVSIILVALLFFAPPIIAFSVCYKYWELLIGYAAVAVLVPLAALIPKSKKERKKIRPKKITIQDEFMVSVTGYGSESRLVSEAKEVRDYGEFYEIVFPIGKISNNFICQKDLLVSGTLEKFEAKFKGKIVKK